MSLAGHLQNVLEKLLIKDNDRAKYTADAEFIRNKLMDDLKKADADFRNAFDGLSLSGSYLDGVKLNTPDEFDMQVKLKFPFSVSPLRDSQRAGFVFLSAPSGRNHPAVVDGFINRKELQNWLRNAFRNVFKSYTRLIVNGEGYDLEYELQGYGCAHTIVATSRFRTISFDFVPVFEYSFNSWPLPTPSSVSHTVRQSWPWFAVPQGKAPANDRTFMVSAPHWEREMMKGNYNLKNILRLMKAMRDVHIQYMPHLSSYMLKTVILLELGSTYNWQKDLGTLFIAMWTKLVERFQTGKLPFFLAHDCNHFDRMKREDFLKCKETAEILLRKVNLLGNRPDFSSVSKLFLE